MLIWLPGIVFSALALLSGLTFSGGGLALFLLVVGWGMTGLLLLARAYEDRRKARRAGQAP